MNSDQHAPTALVIQCFGKPDTLDELCQSLLKCTGVGHLNVVFWSDSPIGAMAEEKFQPLNAAVISYVEAFITKYGYMFKSIEFHHNDKNLGTCKTCQVALDYAFSKFGFVIFIEDDVVLSVDAFEWFQIILSQGLLEDDENWAIAGESIFFNARGVAIKDDRVAKTRALADAEGLQNYYIRHQFVPSTCFATTAENWKVFGETRGQPLGDVDLCKRCEIEKKFCVFPVVPRAKDIGMLHDNGYSVLIHTRAGVSELKNTYLLSDQLSVSETGFEDRYFFEYTGDAGRLFSLTTLLVGDVPLDGSAVDQ